MDINAEVSTQFSLINAIIDVLGKSAPGSSKKNDKEEEDNQDAMPDSTTNNDKTITSPFHCGDDVLVPNKDGRYYLGTIVELSTSNDNDSCEVGASIAQCLVKFGDGTHSWAPLCSLKLLSAPPADDGRIMCVVCKRREGPATSPCSANALVACDMCGRGYHAKCHTPPVDAWINGASWHCKRCVDQRYRVAAAENRAAKRSDICRYKGGQQRRQQQELTPRCDTASTTSSAASDTGNDQSESHCYCGEKSDWLAQMLMCCRCSRWFHQRCVSSLQYPLYAGDKLYIFACCTCNGGSEYLRRLELCWLELAHLALYNLTAYNAPNYFDLDTVIMPYIKDNWHALQLPDKMWLTPVKERRQHILTALTSSRKRFKCGREMKKRATIWGLRLRRPPSPPAYLAALQQIPKGEPLTDSIVREYAPRLRFLPRHTRRNNYNGFQPSSNSYCDKSSYKKHNEDMIVPVDGHWLNLMMGKRFHENLNSNSNSENDSTSCYESTKSNEVDDRRSSPTVSTTNGRESNTKDDNIEIDQQLQVEADIDTSTATTSMSTSLMQCSVSLTNISEQVNDITQPTSPTEESKTQPSKLMNLEASKLSTNNIIEHSKIMSLQNMDELTSTRNSFNINDVDSSGDETSSRGTLDTIIPPLKNFQGKNNPFLMKNSTYSSKLHKENRRNHYHSRVSLPAQLNPAMGSTQRPMKRKLSEKDIVIGPNGEVKRRKHRRPKYMELQLNNSCPLPDHSPKTEQIQDWHHNNEAIPRTSHMNKMAIHGRRLRQRQEKNYFENTRRHNNNHTATINSVQSLQLSPHKVNNAAAETSAQSLSALKSSVQSYFRAGQTFNVLARRLSPNSQPAYLIQWEAASAT